MKLAPKTVADLLQICKDAPGNGEFVRLTRQAFVIRLKEHVRNQDCDKLPSHELSRSVSQETIEIYKELRLQWITFRDGMVKVFGEYNKVAQLVKSRNVLT